LKIKLKKVNKEDDIEAKRKGDGSLLDKIKQKKDQKIRESKRPKYESWSEDVNEVALDMAEIFPTNDIIAAFDGQSSPHIFGWLQDNYRNFQWLLDNYVLEVASYYAKNKLKHKVDIVKVIDNFDIELYEWTRVELTELNRLENYRNQPFKNIIFMSEKPLDDAVYWLEDSDWWIDGQEVRINLGRFCGILIAWLSWNVPVILVSYLPFQNKAVYKAKTDAEKIQKARVSMELKLVHTYRTMISALEEKIDEKGREAKQWHKMYSDLKKDYDLAYRKSLAKAEYSNYGVKKRPINANLALVLGLVVISVIAFIGWMI